MSLRAYITPLWRLLPFFACLFLFLCLLLDPPPHSNDMRRAHRSDRYHGYFSSNRSSQMEEFAERLQQQQQQQQQQQGEPDSSEPSSNNASSSPNDTRKQAASSAPQQAAVASGSSSSSSGGGGSHERSQALERVGGDAKQNWTSLPTEWQTNKEFILQALTKSPTLPPKSDFERQFPQSLRFDRDVVLGFCRRHDFVQLYEERHLFVPGCLTSDKEVMMAYCQRIPRSLQECGEELCNDPEVVNAAISLGGLELQYASLRLQEDKTIVEKACQSHGRALEYCPPGPTRDALTSNLDFMRDVVLAKAGGGPMWKLAPPTLQQDPDLLLQALKNGLSLRDVPFPFCDDWDFLQRALQINASLYLQLLPPMQAKTCLAREAIVSEASTAEIHSKALRHCPSLKSERQIVLSLCQRGDVEYLSELLAFPTSVPFIDDLEIMKVAIERDSNLLSMASPRLQVAPQLILVSITPISAWDTLKSISSTLIRQHPEIPIRAVQKSVARNLRYLPGHIPDDIWGTSRDLCLAWLQRGGRVLEAFEPLLVVQPPYTEEDLELPLAVAKYNWSECYKVGDALLRNREFLLRALNMDGRILRFAPLPLRQEFDIQVMAVANHNNNIRTSTANSTTTLVATTLGGSIDLPRLHTQIQDKLRLQKTFCQDFLRGIAISRPHQPPQLRSQLPMLDRGVETSQAFKRLIAEYLGVPLGRSLALLRQAHMNLAPNNGQHGSTSSSTSAAASSNAYRSSSVRSSDAAAARRREDVMDRVMNMEQEVIHRDHFVFAGGRGIAIGIAGRNPNPNNHHHQDNNPVDPLLHPPQQRDAFVPPGAVARRQRRVRAQRMAFERSMSNADREQRNIRQQIQQQQERQEELQQQRQEARLRGIDRIRDRIFQRENEEQRGLGAAARALPEVAAVLRPDSDGPSSHDDDDDDIFIDDDNLMDPELIMDLR
jgi:hypothetical protein